MKKLFRNTHNYAVISVELPTGQTISLNPGETIYVEESYVRSYNLIKEVSNASPKTNNNQNVKVRDPSGPDIKNNDQSMKKSVVQNISKPSSTTPTQTEDSDSNDNGAEEDKNVNYESLGLFLSSKDDLVSIVILNKDSFSLIKKCVKSIEKYVSYPHEIIVGDTGSEDDSVWDFYDEKSSDKFRVVELGHYNFSENNNEIAEKHAKGDWILFMNNDVFFDSKFTLNEMVDRIRIYKLGAVGLRLLSPDSDLIDHDGQNLIDDNGDPVPPTHVNFMKSPNEVNCRDGKADGVTGACLLTRKNIFLQKGGFSCEYRDVYQDCDYCLELRNDGYESWVIRSPHAYHVGNASRNEDGGPTPIMKKDKNDFLDKWNGKIESPSSPECSFISCVNNKSKYMKMVDSVVGGGDSSKVEFIPVYNKNNHFTVTEALNAATDVADGDFIFYCHQDVLFPDNWLENFRAAKNSVGNFGVVGFEGISKKGSPVSCRSMRNKASQRALTLDELCLVVRSENNLRFDERQKFHFYGADICLNANEKGLPNYVFGVNVNHLSGGGKNIRRDPELFKEESRKFWDKWRKRSGMSKFKTTTTTFYSDGRINYQIESELLNK